MILHGLFDGGTSILFRRLSYAVLRLVAALDSTRNGSIGLELGTTKSTTVIGKMPPLADSMFLPSNVCPYS